MLRLKNLTFEAIGRFVGKQRIDVDALGNLVQVDGLNKNTGGSSGAAKTTIFNALDFLLGVNTLPNSILQSRLTEEIMSVEADFDLDGKELFISRGKKLKIVLDGEVTTGSSKLTEEKLDQILAIPRHLFRPMLHKVQGERGFFLSFTPKETNDFLTDCLGLGRFRKYIEQLDKQVALLLTEIGQNTTNLESAKAGLTALENAKSALGYQPKPMVDRESILRVKAKADYSANSLKELLTLHKEEIAKLEQERPTLLSSEFDSSAIKRIDEEISSIKKELEKLDSEERSRLGLVQSAIYESKTRLSDIRAAIKLSAKAKEEAQKIALEVKKIRENSCPTCEQEWSNESAKNKEQELLKKIGELRVVMSRTLQGEQEVVDEETKLAALILEGTPRSFGESLRQKRAELNVQMDAEKKKQSEHYALEAMVNNGRQKAFAKDQAALSAKHDIALTQVRGQADLDRRTLESSVNSMKMYEDAKARYELASSKLQAQEKELNDKIKTFTLKLEEIKAKSNLLEELKKIVKSYLSCSFDEALEYISESATKMVRNVPNMANATIQLKGIRETKEGKIKEEVNALLHLDGDENIDIRSLCGGERSAIDLAVDLSVIELIENKTNKGINIFILDEPFTGLDTVCIEMALEVLKNSNSNKKLIIVDHNPEVKQMVESKLLVVRDGLTSTVTQN